MRIVIYLLIVWLSAFAEAGGLSNAYERLWIWYAYQIDRTIGSGLIVPGCAGKDCTFTEVMSSLDNADWSATPWLENEGNKTPDIEETAKFIFENSWTNNIRPWRIFAAAQGYPDMLEKVGTYLGQIKILASPEKRATVAFADNAASIALAQALASRKVEYSDFFMRALREEFGSAVKVKTVPNSIGEVYDLQATVEATVAANPQRFDPASIKRDLEDFQGRYESADTTETRHLAPIRSMDVSLNRMGIISCSP
ncbi:hypothetical protein BGZ60DRAFT_528938 [Tricladium varicosporioides]|nr:hypothetical protein BGZ60DRAFT_528938 [Hymenoscyphus varicosporioides]